MVYLIEIFEKNAKASWLITIIIAGTIFYISSLTFPSGAGGTNVLSIFYHIFVFFFLGFFLLISSIKGKKINFVLVAIIIVLVYALSDEIHQFFVPGRQCSFSDFTLDSFGILSASFLYLLSIKYRKK